MAKAIPFFLLVLALIVGPINASANWDGPVDAAIDQLAATLQGLGLERAGVRPFGYGFTFELIEDEAEESQTEESLVIASEEQAATQGISLEGGNRV